MVKSGVIPINLPDNGSDSLNISLSTDFPLKDTLSAYSIMAGLINSNLFFKKKSTNTLLFFSNSNAFWGYKSSTLSGIDQVVIISF